MDEAFEIVEAMMATRARLRSGKIDEGTAALHLKHDAADLLKLVTPLAD